VVSTVAVALSGALGRMGRAVTAAIDASEGRFRLAQAIGRSRAGEDVGVVAGGTARGLVLSTELAKGADVAIDFSTPEGAAARAREAARLAVPLVACTTGLEPAHERALEDAAAKVPVLVAANTSVGVALLTRLVGEVARALGPDYDVELLELHHRGKKDAPSGTALALAKALCAATSRDLERDLVHGRRGKTPRRTGEVGVHALRLGDVAGEHRVFFAGEGERIELAHVATSRDTFARGALRAAAFLVGKKPGRYSMADVIGSPQG
jgi:4-hydroxy-tetrahydrodipicolinate reductase